MAPNCSDGYRTTESYVSVLSPLWPRACRCISRESLTALHWWGCWASMTVQRAHLTASSFVGTPSHGYSAEQYRHDVHNHGLRPNSNSSISGGSAPRMA